MSFTVRPRYTPGSPALVDGATAMRVASEEKDAFRSILEGTSGEKELARAKLLGLDGIVQARAEAGTGRNFRWVIQDLCTQNCYLRPSNGTLRETGFTLFEELKPSDRAQIVGSGSLVDFEGTFWKLIDWSWHKFNDELAYTWSEADQEWRDHV